MSINDILQKITSRKFLCALAGLATGLAMAFGLDTGVITSVAGAVVSVASVITYIITEGKVDAAAVAQAVERVGAAVEELEKAETEAGDDEQR
ncbi:MAG: hypothetical protein LUC83_09355 [Clostridiales bacterium]|nr:hypothetical protein [Clostridiales bacterium]